MKNHDLLHSNKRYGRCRQNALAICSFPNVAGEASGRFTAHRHLECRWLAGPVNLRLCIIKEALLEINPQKSVFFDNADFFGLASLRRSGTIY
jgi:hypothetical protein